LDKNALKAAAVLALVIAAIGGYFFWQDKQTTSEAAKAVPTSDRPLATNQPAPAQQVLEVPTVQSPVPKLTDSDSFVIAALAELISNKSLMKLFHTDKIIRNIVATIDNLPRMKLPLKVLPLEQPAGKFMISGNADNLTISPQNAARYTPYVQLAEAIDPNKLLDLYVRIYPLFQQAYRELGYPNQNFNDRLVEVLDDLLDAPDIKKPVKLLQPKVFYQYADPDLEELSIGQRILMRTGSKNEARLKVWLSEIKQAQSQRMHDQKRGAAE
jgi:hypothetical protein